MRASNGGALPVGIMRPGAKLYPLITCWFVLAACGLGTGPARTGVEDEPYPLATGKQGSQAAGYPAATAARTATHAAVPTQTPTGASFTGTPEPIPTRTAYATTTSLPTADLIGTPGYWWNGPGFVYQSAGLTLSNFDGSQKNVFAQVPPLQLWNSDYSRQAGRIVYDDDDSLWVLDLGKGSESILSTEQYIESPVISRDGAEIAYSLIRGLQVEAAQLWTIHADGSENRLLIDHTEAYITDPGPFRLIPVAWSLDRSRIYMTTTTDSEATPVGMYVADVSAGSIEKALTPQVTLWDLSFSADRTRIAYRTFQWVPVQGSMPEVGPPFTLQVTDLATGATTILQESDSFEYSDPVWSDDGNHIAYSVRSRQLGGEIGLFSIELATGAAIRLVPGSEGKYLRPWAWLSDDRLVYTEENTGSAVGANSLATLYTIKIDGSDQHEIDASASVIVLGVLDETPN